MPKIHCHGYDVNSTAEKNRLSLLARWTCRHPIENTRSWHWDREEGRCKLAARANKLGDLDGEMEESRKSRSGAEDKRCEPSTPGLIARKGTACGSRRRLSHLLDIAGGGCHRAGLLLPRGGKKLLLTVPIEF